VLENHPNQTHQADLILVILFLIMLLLLPRRAC